MSGAIKLSVVVPAFNEEKNIPHFYRELTGVLNKSGLSYETIFVDNDFFD